MKYSRWKHWLCAFTFHTWQPTPFAGLMHLKQCSFCGVVR